MIKKNKNKKEMEQTITKVVLCQSKMMQKQAFIGIALKWLLSEAIGTQKVIS